MPVNRPAVRFKVKPNIDRRLVGPSQELFYVGGSHLILVAILDYSFRQTLQTGSSYPNIDLGADSRQKESDLFKSQPQKPIHQCLSTNHRQQLVQGDAG
jgi:hypothetical protein